MADTAHLELDESATREVLFGNRENTPQAVHALSSYDVQ